MSYRVFMATASALWARCVDLGCTCIGVLREASGLCLHRLHDFLTHRFEYLLSESLLTQTTADAASPRGRIRSGLCLCGRFLSSREKPERTDEVTWHHCRTVLRGEPGIIAAVLKTQVRQPWHCQGKSVLFKSRSKAEI